MAEIVVAKGVQLEPQNAAIAARPGSKMIQDVLGSLKQVDDQGVATDIGSGGASGTQPKAGANLTDANQTLQPVTDKASLYRQVTPLTANRTKTLGTTNAFAGLTVYIQREDTAAFTLAVVNGGVGAGTLFTFAATPTEAQLCAFQFDGINWNAAGFSYITVSG